MIGCRRKSFIVIISSLLSVSRTSSPLLLLLISLWSSFNNFVTVEAVIKLELAVLLLLLFVLINMEQFFSELFIFNLDNDDPVLDVDGEGNPFELKHLFQLANNWKGKHWQMKERGPKKRDKIN